MIKARPYGIFSPGAYVLLMKLRIGKTKDRVFPLPVSDRQSKSASLSECLSVSACILVGLS